LQGIVHEHGFPNRKENYFQPNVIGGFDI